MDSIGDILYVLFIVIALVASVMKKRKQQEAVPPFVPDNEQEIDLPEELKEIFQKKKQEAIRPQKSRTEVNDELLKKGPEKKFQTGIVTSIVAKKSEDAYQETVPSDETGLEDVDWERAVVLSEVLKRPQHFPE